MRQWMRLEARGRSVADELPSLAFEDEHGPDRHRGVDVEKSCLLFVDWHLEAVVEVGHVAIRGGDKRSLCGFSYMVVDLRLIL
jgi:hypothetical protein